MSGHPGTDQKDGFAASSEIAQKGRSLYRVDLSSVVSKYIGETEKNLKTLFDRAENTDLVILLDKADELFGKRTAVKDADDRHANNEFTYLLKRIGTYPGILILTTNRIANLDPAFVRRARFTVQLPLSENEGEEESGDR
jgi:SpoVK/Ycf46/Vps4 family AAA+-type ATPase